MPAWSLGQHFLGGKAWEKHPVATLMAAALPSHLTFFSDLRELPDAVIEQARPWLDLYKRHRALFTQMTYPLLADPLEQGWTALQSWNPRRGRGALLAFRQQDERAGGRRSRCATCRARSTSSSCAGPRRSTLGTVDARARCARA